MSSRIQSQRFAATTQRPAANSRPPGELWLNFADLKLGFIDQSQAPVDLLPIRIHAPTATYAAGDYVTHGGQLFRSFFAVPPRAFTSMDWDPLLAQSQADVRYYTKALADAQFTTQVQNDARYYTKAQSDALYTTQAQNDARYYTQAQSDGAYLRLTGGAMQGPLTLAADPVSAMQAATRQYADSKMPIAGGTFTGSIATVAGTDIFAGRNLYVYGSLLIDPTNGWEWNHYREASSGDHIQMHRGGQWYERWSSTDGSRHWAAPSGYIMNLDGSGNLSIVGQFNCGPLIASTLSAQSLTLPAGWSFYFNGSQHIQQHTANWYDAWDTSGGARHWVNGGAEVMTLDGGGSLSVAGNIHTGAQISGGSVVGGSFTVTGTGLELYSDGGNGRFLQFSPNWEWLWSQADGTLMWVANGNWAFMLNYGTQQLQWIMTGGCFKPGGGPWADNSDARIKDILGDYETGLAQLKHLKPKRYRFKGNDGPYHRDSAAQGIEYVGFIGQDVAAHMPEMAKRMKGEIDGITVDDMIAVDTNALIYALVNAVNELAERI